MRKSSASQPSDSPYATEQMTTPQAPDAPSTTQPTADPSQTLQALKLGQHVFARKASLLYVSGLTVMSTATIAPSLPAIQAHFADVPQAAMLTRLVLTAPPLFIAICATVAGAFSDRFGRRRLLIASLLLYGFSGMSGLLLDTLPSILLGRAMLGIAVAGTMSTATALIGDYYAGAARDRFMGLQAAFMAFGGLVLLTGGGLLAELHWRAPFAAYGLAFLAIPVVLLYLFEPARSERHGTTTHQAPTPPRTWAAIVLLLLAAVLNSMAFYINPTQLPYYLKTLGVPAPTVAGLTLGTSALVMGLTALRYSRVLALLGLRWSFCLGFGLMSVGFGLTAAANSYWLVFAGMIFFGLGLGVTMPGQGTGAMMLAPPAKRGQVAGALTACIFLGQFLSPVISTPVAEAHGIATAFAVSSGLVAVLAVVAGFLALLGGRIAPPRPMEAR